MKYHLRKGIRPECGCPVCIAKRSAAQYMMLPWHLCHRQPYVSEWTQELRIREYRYWARENVRRHIVNLKENVLLNETD